MNALAPIPPAARRLLPLLLLLASLGGCGLAHYAPAPVDAERVQQEVLALRLDDPALREHLAGLGVEVSTWPKRRWRVEELAAAALMLNPELAVARAEWAARRAGVLSAGQRPNPEATLGLEHHSDTPGEETPWGLLASLGLVVETAGKREARLAEAQARALQAREEAAVAAWQVRSAIRRACVALVGAERALHLLERRRTVAAEALRVLDRRVELGESGALEASALRIEEQRLQLAVNRARSDRVEARVSLAQALGLSPAAVEALEVDLPAWERPRPPEALPAREARARALLARHDVRAALAAYAAAEAGLREAVAAQYPDLTLTPGIFFDQSDTIWQFGSALLLPVLHTNAGPVAEALAVREREAARLRALQALVIGEVEAAALRYAEAAAALAETERLREALTARERTVASQVELGYADQLEGVRARLESALALEVRESALLDLQRAQSGLEEALQRPLEAALALPLLPEAPADAGEGRP